MHNLFSNYKFTNYLSLLLLSWLSMLPFWRCWCSFCCFEVLLLLLLLLGDVELIEEVEREDGEEESDEVDLRQSRRNGFCCCLRPPDGWFEILNCSFMFATVCIYYLAAGDRGSAEYVKCSLVLVCARRLLSYFLFNRLRTCTFLLLSVKCSAT